MESYQLEVDKVLIKKDYIRLISSGFLHVDPMHLLFNMMSLIAFAKTLENYVGVANFLFIYFASMIGGNLLALFTHRNYGDYSAVGASGAICGVVFSYIALFPHGGILVFFMVPMAAWFYGIIYVFYTIYGVKAAHDNVGHEAHLGGALLGIALTCLLFPLAFAQNYVIILAMALPIFAFLFMVVKNPSFLLLPVKIFFQKGSNTKAYSIEDRYNEKKRATELDVDAVLEKIRRSGLDSLTQLERELLDRQGRR